MRARANFCCPLACGRPCLQIIDEKARRFTPPEDLVPIHNLVFLCLKEVIVNAPSSFLAQMLMNCFFMQPFGGFNERVERNMGEHHLAAVSKRGYRIAGKAGEASRSRIEELWQFFTPRVV